MWDFLLTELPDIILVGVGLCLFAWTILGPLFLPSRKGVVLGLSMFPDVDPVSPLLPDAEASGLQSWSG